MPIDSVSRAAPWALSCPCRAATLANQARWRSRFALLRRDAHEAAQLEARQLRHGGRERGQLGRFHAALAELAGHVHLQAHVQGRGVVGPLRRKTRGDLHTIHRVHPGEGLGDRTRLVGLHPADEVPGERVVVQCRNLLQPFLQVALAEILEAQAGRGGQRFRRLRLADGQDCDRLRTPPAGCGGPGYAFADFSDAQRQILRTH